MKKILIGCTGSVAALKLPVLIEKMYEELGVNGDLEVKVVVTNHAQHFFSMSDIPKQVQIFRDEDEWSSWSKRGDPVLHIELSKWADMLVIAPLDANTLAKISNGLCDNLLTCVSRAWEKDKPLIFCPAMNTKMYQHPVTGGQIGILQSWGYIMVPCIEKTLICGDTGIGAMATVNTIVAIVVETFRNKIK